MLCTLGDLVEDVLVRIQAPVREATDTAALIERARGGSAANVAALAAADGTPSRFIGQVGDDPTGDRLVAQLVADGVDARVCRRGRTGTIVVLVDAGGERTMLSDRGSAIELDDVPSAWLTGVTWLHLPAYSLTVEPLRTTAHVVAARVRESGGRLSVDVSSVSVVEEYGAGRFGADLAALVPDVVFATAEEAALLPAVPALRGVAGLTGLAGLPVRGAGDLVVVKHGPRPIELRRGDGTVEHVAVDVVADVIDTTGAGDAFAAGFIGARLPRGIAVGVRPRRLGAGVTGDPLGRRIARFTPGPHAMMRR